MTSQRRSLFLLYSTTFLVFLNFYTAQTITPMYILHVGGTEFYSGLQSTLFFLMAVILRFYFGPLGDRKGDKLTLSIGAFAFTTAPILFLLHDAVWYILLVRTYQSIGLAAYFSSSSSLASALAPPHKLGTYIGFYRVVIMSTLMVGPTFALRIIGDYGYIVYHISGVVIGILSLIILYFIKDPKKDISEKSSSPDVIVPRENMLVLLKDKRLLPIYQSIFILSISYGLVLTFVGIYIERSAPGINPGIFFSLFGLGSIISNLTSGPLSDRKGRAAVAFPCMLIMGVGVSIFYFLPVYNPILYAGSFIAGFGYAGTIAILITWIIDLANPAKRTSALALQDSAIDIGISFGSFFFGIMVPIIGMAYSFGLGGTVLSIFALWKIVSSVRNRLRYPVHGHK